MTFYTDSQYVAGVVSRGEGHPGWKEGPDGAQMFANPKLDSPKAATLEHANLVQLFIKMI